MTLLNGILEQNEKQLSKSAPVIPEESHLNLLVDVGVQKDTLLLC